jgi:hypothetical protein
LIRSSALLTAVAMAMLVAGAFAANLRLIYLSIAVSILAAVTLAAGVLLRRRGLFGEAGAAPRRAQAGQAGAETAKARPVPARPAADGRIPAGRGAPREDNRRDGEPQGDPAARLRKAGSGTAAGTGSARWPASIAAKGAPAAARRGGGRQAGRGRAARSPSGREPAAREPGAREPARSDWAGRDRTGHERGDREPAGREPAAREAIGREPVPTGSTGPGTGWPPPPGREAGPGRPAEPGRDQASAAAPPGREHAGRGPGRGGERDRAAPRAGRARTTPGRDRDKEAPARGGREQAGRERDEAAAGEQAEAFRLPPPSERTRARAEELGRALSGNQAGDDFWDRVSDELVEGGRQDPVRPAWPATAGPRAMGTGSAARPAPGEAGDELEEAGPGGFRQSEPAPWDRGATAGPPDEERDRNEQPAGTGAEPRWDRVVPRYVDDLDRRGRQRREHERDPSAAGEPDDHAAPAGTTAGPAASSAWSAWSGGDRGTADAGRAGQAEAEEPSTGKPPAGVSAAAGTGGGAAGAGQAGRDAADRGTAQAERASIQAPAGAAADTAADAARETGDHEAEAGVRGDEGADQAGPGAAAGPRPGGAAPGGAGRFGAVDPGQTAGRTAAAESAGESDRAAAAGADGSTPLDDEVTVVPGVPRYHRRGCILIRFLSDGDLETATRREAEATGLVPCKACQPDKPASAAG